MIVDTRTNLGPDFCNKIGTHSPFAALHKFGSYWGFRCRAFVD